MQLPDIATEARDFWVRESELKKFLPTSLRHGCQLQLVESWRSLSQDGGLPRELF
jgi:hypothetical protein